MEVYCKDSIWQLDSVFQEIFNDSSLCLEHTALSWIPFIFTILSGLFLLRKAVKKERRSLPKTYLLLFRTVVSLLLVVASVATCCMVPSVKANGVSLNAVDVAAYSLNAVAMICLFLLTLLCGRQGIITSGSLFLSIVFYCLFDSFEFSIVVRRFIHDNWNGLDVCYAIYYCLLVIQLIVNCWADQQDVWDKPARTKEIKKENPEKTVSFINRITYAFFDPIAWRGWRHGMQTEDLWLLLPKDTVEELRRKWESSWKVKSERFLSAQHHERAAISYDSKKSSVSLEAVVHKAKRKPPSVLISLTECFKWQVLASFLLKTMSDILEFMKPQVLRSLIQYMEISDLSLSYGIFFSFMLPVIGIFQSLLLQKYYVTMYRVGMNVKSILISAIFEKALRLSNESRRQTTAGEMTNMMSVDVERILEMCPYVLLIWSAPLEVILAVVFLWRNLGPSVLAGLGLMCQIQQMELKDKRLKMMNEVLNGIKVLKLHAWEPAFEKKLVAVRKKELQMLRKAAIYGSIVTFTWTMAPSLITVVSFAAFLLSDPSNELTPEVAFVSLSLFNILQLPISLIPIIVAYTIHAYVSLKRLSLFLNHDEIDESVVCRTDDSKYAVNFDKGTFSWEANNKDSAILRNLNLKVTKGTCVAVIGRVGTGKSSFCSAILGEMYKLNGSITVSGNIAYVPQQAWILNTTVRSNVLFYSPERPEFYKKVVHACGLDVDIEEMQNGDQTVIGEKGSNLSGGQKQRLSLARAVYQDADIYLLDDPLSAVDSRVGRHIFDNVIGKNGLLKEKTRIFVTNALAYLKEVDIIVILNNGEIEKIGTPSELLKEESILKQFLQEEDDGKEEEEEKSVSDEEGVAERSETLSRKEIISSSATAERVQTQTSVTSIKSLARTSRRASCSTSDQHGKQSIVTEDKSGGLTEEESMETGRVAWRIYGMYMKSIGILQCIVVLIGHVISCAFSVVSSSWLARWSEDALLSTNDSRYVSPDVRIGGYAGLGIAQSFFIFLGSLALAFGTVTASAKLHAHLLHSLLRVPMSFYETTPLGRVINRIGKDIDMVDNMLPNNIRGLMNTFSQVATALVIIMINMSVFGVIVIPLAVLYWLLQRFYVATSRQLQRMEAVSRSPIYSLFQEVVQGITSVRAYRGQAWFRKKFDLLIDENQMNYYPKIISNRWLAVRIEFISTVMVFCASIFAVYNRDTNVMSAGMVGLSVTYSMTITQALNWVMEITSYVETNIVSVERIDEYLQLKHEAAWKTDHQPPPDWPSQGNVVFNKYSTRYRPGLDLALKDISFIVNTHEKVGIVGRTGAGKSSITLALFRIVEPADGTIYIDGVNIRELGLHDLRSRISIIPQDPVLFFGTIRMNIDPPEEKTDDEIWLALEQANLKPFVSSLPEKLDYNISEGGENLSLGQRQMICLARALLRKSRILVLDEATAAVDLETDQLIQTTIQRFFGDCTVLTIAHRLNTVLDSNRILLLRNGHLMENDSPKIYLRIRKVNFTPWRRNPKYYDR
uniref:ABC-type glutathione-S-conjugate transporter n=1 Tax=Trichuris muris TaxID=70415 RepID=A0A5S6Q235_TRIMR